jgi:hypothetical protein
MKAVYKTTSGSAYSDTAKRREHPLARYKADRRRKSAKWPIAVRLASLVLVTVLSWTLLIVILRVVF